MVSVSWPLIALMTGLTALVVIGIVRVAIRTRRMPPVNIGIASNHATPVPTNTVGEVRRALAPIGTVYAAGEEWSARAASGQVVARGTTVRVMSQEGLTLVVEPAQEALPTAPPAPA
jgi:membrane-bound ClpP family serine protease